MKNYMTRNEFKSKINHKNIPFIVTSIYYDENGKATVKETCYGLTKTFLQYLTELDPFDELHLILAINYSVVDHKKYCYVEIRTYHPKFLENN